MSSQFANYLRTLREKGPETDASGSEQSHAGSGESGSEARSGPPSQSSPQPSPAGQSPRAKSGPAEAERFVNVALRDGEVLILGLTEEPLAVNGRTAERLARRLLDAVALARGQHPDQTSGS
ncbi:MAG TPA: hypothetical protein VF459_15905 [Caulobacteraceae bacterium]